MSVAVTEESTPPDNAHMTFLFPIWFFRSLIFSSLKEPIDQFLLNPDINKKLLRSFKPFLV